MNSNIQIFNNPAFGQIRTTGTSEQPLFCLVDVCKVLGLNPSKAAQRLTDDVLSKYPINDNIGREQFANFVNEDGLYDVMLDSRKPEAKAFRKWVTSEVLPQIRRTGGYIPLSQEDDEKTILAKAVMILNRTVEEQKNRVEAAERKTLLLQSQNEVQAERLEANDRTIKYLQPGATFAKAVQTSDTSILVGDLARIIKQNGVEIGQNRLFEWLRKKSYLISRKGESYNLPTQSSLNLGLFEIKKTIITRPDGTSLITTTPKVTGKGQVYFVNKFLYETINESELARQKAERESKKGGAQ